MPTERKERAKRPIFAYLLENHISEILLSSSFYFFGAAYSLFLGFELKLVTLVFGWLVVIFLMGTMELLNLVFLEENHLELLLIEIFGYQNYRLFYFIFAGTFMGVALIIVLLNFSGGMTLLLFLLILVFMILYVVRPFRLISSGYGEMINALLITFLIPSFAYASQTSGRLHQDLVYLCIPFFFLELANLYLFSNKQLTHDLQRGHITATIKFGSVVTLRAALYLVAGSYVFMTLVGFARIPSRFMVRWLLSSPLALFLIFQVDSILRGKKPNWFTVELLSKALIYLNLLLLIFAFLVV